MSPEKLYHFTVSAYIIHPELQKVLLIHHKILKMWMGPGGHIEPDEDVENALFREVAEETGISKFMVLSKKRMGKKGRTIELFRPDILEVHPIPTDRRHAGLHYHINHIYYGWTTEVTLRHNADETNSVGWFSAHELNQLPMDASSLYHARQALRKCSRSAKRS